MPDTIFNDISLSNIEAVKQKLADGVNIHATNKYGETPLHYAAKMGKTDICAELLKAGANLHAKVTIPGNSPLFFTRLNTPQSETLTGINQALNTLQSEILRGINQALDTPHRLNVLEYNKTPLHMASCILGKVDTIKLFLENGARIDEKDIAMRTPLHIAASSGSKDICAILLQNHAEVNNTDILGETPLHIAALSGRPEICSLLIENGADKNAMNNRNETPHDVAIRFGDTITAQVFCDTTPAEEQDTHDDVETLGQTTEDAA